MGVIQELRVKRTMLLSQASREERFHVPTLQNFTLQINILIGLLEKDAQIESALSVIASDLAAIVASLNQAKQIK